MKQKPEYICEVCGFRKEKPKGIVELLKNLAKSIFIIFIVITSLIGTAGIYNIYVVGVNEDLDRILTFGSIYATLADITLDYKYQEDTEKLKIIAENLTKHCQNDECKVGLVFKELYYFDYEYGENLRALEVWDQRKGDCDEITNLMIQLLKTQNIKGKMSCNTNHCYGVFWADDKKIIADVVNGEYSYG